MENKFNEREMAEALTVLTYKKVDILECEAAGFDYVPSKKFSRKMAILFRNERHFGRNIWIGKGLRTVASIVLIVCSLIVAGTVAAKVLGIKPWDYIVKISPKDKMADRIYTSTSGSVQEGRELVAIKHNEPTYIPRGYEEVERDNSTDFAFDVGWLRKKDKNSGLDYSRIRLGKGLKMSTDAEYTVSEKIEIAGYIGYYRKKDKYEWIMWDDEKYAHMVYAVSVENARQEMERMANSLYE